MLNGVAGIIDTVLAIFVCLCISVLDIELSKYNIRFLSNIGVKMDPGNWEEEQQPQPQYAPLNRQRYAGLSDQEKMALFVEKQNQLYRLNQENARKEKFVEDLKLNVTAMQQQ